MQISIWDILDILIVSYLIYRVYKLLRGSIAFNIFVGLALVYIVWWLVNALEMQLLSTLLTQFVSLGVILLIIIFQPEIRRFLLDLGNTTLQRRSRILKRLFGEQLGSEGEREKMIEAIYHAAQQLSKARTGALMVLNNVPDNTIEAKSGTILNANVAANLLLSIFNKESPLHDGAVIIQNNKLYAASAVLPVSENQNLPDGVGLRHRAGVGITEETEAGCVIVSETDGTISIAFKGQFQQNIYGEKLKAFIDKHM